MGRAKYRKIVHDISEQIRSGVLRPGARLPTHRALAYTHGVSLGTATRIYAELFELGLVSGEVGRGTFVRAPVATKAAAFFYDREASNVVDLSRNFMVIEGQAEHFASAVAKTLEAEGHDLLLYQPHAGRDRDRAAGASWLSTDDVQFSVDPSRVLVCNGGQHGLTLSLLATTQPGDIVAVEAYTYPGLKVLASVLRIRLVPVALDQHGIVPTDLDTLCRKERIKALYCMPTVQNPLGIVMPIERRREIAALAAHHDFRIIEDDAYGFLVENSPPPLASFAPERSYYLRTTSKSLAPGIRVAYLVAPEEDVARLTVIVRATTWTAPPLMAGLATRWIMDGTAGRLIVEKRMEARCRQALAAEILNGYEHSAHPASFHLWLKLPPGCRTDDFLVAARERNVLVSPASLFKVGDAATAIPQAVRLCLGAPQRRADLERALRTIVDVLRQRAQGLMGVV
jgi:DNA-binding transcriptional MocR family regulator